MDRSRQRPRRCCICKKRLPADWTAGSTGPCCKPTTQCYRADAVMSSLIHELRRTGHWFALTRDQRLALYARRAALNQPLFAPVEDS